MITHALYRGCSPLLFILLGGDRPPPCRQHYSEIEVVRSSGVPENVQQDALPRFLGSLRERDLLFLKVLLTTYGVGAFSTYPHV